MNTTLNQDDTKNILKQLNLANDTFIQSYPGETENRQPIHTIYGGAQLFKATTAKKIGELALKNFKEYAPNFCVLSKALHMPGFESIPVKLSEQEKLVSQVKENGTKDTSREVWLAANVYEQIEKKIIKEAVEDFRVDFEDGFGNRPDEEEDQVAINAAKEMAQGLKENILPPFIGIRIKPFNKELTTRGVRTLDLFLTTLLEASSGVLPANFVVTLPKVQIPEQVTSLVELFKVLEKKMGLKESSLKMEIMIETTQAIINHDGKATVRSLINAAEGRCTGAHFGTYDYTASCDVTAKYQLMDNPVCDFARHVMKVSLAGTGVFISDGATNVMPVGPHRSKDETLSQSQIDENILIVHGAWRQAYDHTMHSLKHAYYQGWDLHPAQVPVRYAACYTFFLDGFNEASTRLKNFMEKAAQATLSGDVFDDAATGQGLLNYFLRALNCGAINESDIERAGLSLEEVRTKSFAKILKARRSKS
jgi:citrate lyase beta subunit